MTLPVTSRRVNLSLLHPSLIDRLEALFAVLPGLKVVSGARTYAEQKYLYDGYRSGRRGFNLAANPDRKWRSGEGQGSRHQVQPSGWAYAADLRRGPHPWKRVHEVARQVGLVANVPGEAWHFVGNRPGSLTDWLPVQDSGLQVQVAPPRRVAISTPAKRSRQPLLRRGSRGVSVQYLQLRLAALGWLPGGEADGIYGPRTLRAVAAFQRASHLAADGICGQLTWRALLAQQAARHPRPKVGYLRAYNRSVRR